MINARGILLYRRDRLLYSIRFILRWEWSQELELFLCGRQNNLLHSFGSSCHLLSSFNIAFGPIIQPQTEKGQEDTKALDRVDSLVEPNDSNANDGYPLDKRSDRVGDRGCCS